jgi:hypothetical protein
VFEVHPWYIQRYDRFVGTGSIYDVFVQRLALNPSYCDRDKTAH